MAAAERTITVEASGGASAGRLPAWIQVSMQDSSGTSVLSEEQVRQDPGATSYTWKVALDNGTYSVAIVGVAKGYDAPVATPLVTFDDQTSQASVSMELSAAAPAAASVKPEAWLTPALAAAVAAATAFWVAVLALPEKASNGIEVATFVGFLVIGGALVVAGTWLLIRGKATTTAIMLAIAGAALVGIGIALRAELDLDQGRRMGIGVGGLAVAALVVGLQRFDTIRATVAIPITVLFIGITTWPGAATLVGPDLRSEITKWVGVLLGATAVAEGVTQAATAVAEGKAQAAAITAGLTTGGGQPGSARLVAPPAGDVARARSEQQ